jgi:hypothetical protein
MANPDRGIRYSYAMSRYRVNRDDAIRVRFDIIRACEMASKVFAYRMLPLSPRTSETVGTYSHVCSPVDLEEYPEDAPLADQSPEWFRLSYVDVLVRSREEAESFINVIKADINSLYETLNRIDDLEPGTETLLGQDCPTESSSSDSSESSDSSSESLGAVMELSAMSSFTRSLSTGEAWENTGTGAAGEVSSSDSDSANFARVQLASGQSSQVLSLQGFDFSDLPDAATVVGIQAKVWLRNVYGGSSSSISIGGEDVLGTCPPLTPLLPGGQDPPLLSFLALYQPGLGVSGNEATDDSIASDQFETMTFGGDTFLWGLTWTAAALKQGEFGVNLIVRTLFTTSRAAVEVDGAEVTVYYRV